MTSGFQKLLKSFICGQCTYITAECLVPQQNIFFIKKCIGFQREHTSHINSFQLTCHFRVQLKLRHTVRQAEPVTPSIVYTFHSFIGFRRQGYHSFLMSVLNVFAFSSAMKSNPVPVKNKKDLLVPKFLFRKDISWEGDILKVSMK